MTNTIVKTCTLATLASAALAGRTSNALAPGVNDPCHAHSNVTAWKTFNGEQAPGLGAAQLPRHYQTNTSVTGYVCINGNCTRQTVVPPAELATPAAYLEQDPGYGSLSLNNDLSSFATLQGLALTGDATDACFAYHLTQAFAGEPVFAQIGNNTDISLATNAAFLQSFWSKVPNLSDALQHYPEQVPVYYNLITGYKADCSQVLGNYIGSSQKP